MYTSVLDKAILAGEWIVGGVNGNGANSCISAACKLRGSIGNSTWENKCKFKQVRLILLKAVHMPCSDGRWATVTIQDRRALYATTNITIKWSTGLRIDVEVDDEEQEYFVKVSVSSEVYPTTNRSLYQGCWTTRVRWDVRGRIWRTESSRDVYTW